MKINHQETKRRFEAMGLSQAKYARAKGYPEAVFQQVLNGNYGAMTSPRALAIIDDLRLLGVLAEEPNGNDQAA